MPGNSAGAISGVVNSPARDHLSSQILVTVKSTTSGLARTVVTDASGHFEFQGLPNGSYTVSVAESGYEPASAAAFVGGVGANVSLDLRPTNSSAGAAGPSTVSVRQLAIPAKAQKAFQEGLIRLHKQDFSGSVPYFQKAIEKYPDYFEAHYHLGVAQSHLGQMDVAANSFQSAINLSGGHYPWAEFAYALILCERGAIKDAETLVHHGLEMDQSSPDGYVVQGVVLLHLHQLDEAEKSAREALLRDARSASAYLVLADVHSLKNDYAAEIEDLNAFLSLNPKSTRTQSVIGLRDAAQWLASGKAAASAK